MVLSTYDERYLQLIECPFINPTVALSASDQERLDTFFSTMKARRSKATVNEIIDFITTRNNAPQFTPWILEGIRKVANRYFPESDGSDPVFKIESSK